MIVDLMGLLVKGSRGLNLQKSGSRSQIDGKLSIHKHAGHEGKIAVSPALYNKATQFRSSVVTDTICQNLSGLCQVTISIRLWKCD